MANLWARFSLSLFALTFSVCQAQTAIPDFMPELKYPPIARVARVQGDVVVSFQQTLDGRTADVRTVSGPPMLQGIAVENVKAWHFATMAKPAGQVHKVTFHFQLHPSDDRYDNSQPITKVELDGIGGIRVLSVFTTGLERSECPSAVERALPSAVMSGDFVEVDRWNEVVRVDVDGSVAWEQGKTSQRGHIPPDQAKSLLEQFRTQSVWSLCGRYNQAGLMDGDGSSFKVRIGGREKNVGEYGDVAPPIFREVELAVDAAANTHQWRHGDPSRESIIEITYEYLPKPGKTKLMDAAQRGDKAGVQAALAAGDKLTDVDASGWTPLMYAASSYGESVVSEMLKAGANVNARSRRGETALMASAVTGMADEELLDARADVNVVNDVGMTTLMLLVQRGEPDEIKTLLKAGASTFKKDAAGRTALDYLNAANCGRPIVKERDPKWMTAEYSRCNALNKDDYRKSKELLIDAGASVGSH
ncbi:TonB family protein [Granulicella mallensis]|uniref:TonB family protein n=1 Tax=Granulicella mallensis TaxID=940614 RepID=A0A7W7ZLV0_9BACT|nr:TonB family protein [Granulicella mallensis]MBB5062316.1 TonB family protein [Granulicella mallensis]